MSMNLGSPDGEEDAMNASINTTPLVDVMLVLLIIFLITIPVVTQSVQLQLPALRHHRERDQEDDQQHQHHIDQRRGVDGRVHLVFVAVRRPDEIGRAHV